MNRSLYPAALLLATFAFTGCLLGNSGDGAVSMGGEAAVIPYVLAGNKIISGGQPDTDFYCEGDVPHTEVYPGHPDTVEFQVSATTMTIYNSIDTSRLGVVVQRIATLLRVGPGSGVEGTWKEGDQSYRVLSGTLSAEEKAEYDSDLVRSKKYMAYTEYSVVIGAGRITTYVDARTADRFIADWNGTLSDHPEDADSLRYDMTAKAVDKYTVELKGRKTGETVRVTRSPLGDMTYTSDNPAHAAYHYIHNARTCPNDPQPQWYSEFQSNNSKEPGILQKSGQIHPKADFSRPLQGLPRPFRGFPLKSPGSFLN
jgi:hypothetical protein